MFLNKFYCFAYFLGFFAIAKSAQAHFYLQPLESQSTNSGTWEFVPDITFARSKKNYSSTGVASNLPSLGSVNHFDAEIGMRYGISARFSIFGRFQWVNRTISSSTTRDLDVVSVNGPTSNSGFGDQTFGVNFGAWELAESGHKLDIQLEGTFATYDNAKAKSGGKPFLGDGSNNVTVSGIGRFVLFRPWSSDFSLDPAFGYTYRNQGFSAHLPYSMMFRLTPRNISKSDFGLGAGAGLFGVHSLETDDNPVGTGTSAVNNHSHFAEAVNPSLLNARGELTYLINSEVNLKTYFNYSISGSNSPQLWAAGINAVIALPGSKATPSVASAKGKKSSSDDSSFDLLAEVTAFHGRLNLAKIDKGSADGVAVGDSFDFFDGENNRIARGRVKSVRDSETVVEVVEYFEEVRIQKGFEARRHNGNN